MFLIPSFKNIISIDEINLNLLLLQIIQGGKVPKELYLKNGKKISTLSEQMTSVNIKKGDKLYLNYTVTVPQSFLR